jgi:hypothetical protein
MAVGIFGESCREHLPASISDSLFKTI